MAGIINSSLDPTAIAPVQSYDPALGTASQANATGYSATPYSSTGYNATPYGSTSYDATPYTSQGYSPTDYSSQGYGATPYTSQGYTPTDYSSQGYGATPYIVAPNATVQQQVWDIVKNDSPLMQQAQQRAMQQMNQRGLINSSLAVGAGQQAVIANALPIAQQDANAYYNAMTNTANAQNTASQFGANAANQASLKTGDARNLASQFTAAAANLASTNTANAQNAASQFNTAAENLALTNTANAHNAASQFNTAAVNSALTNTANAQNAASQFSAAAENATSQLNAQLETQMNATNANAVNASLSLAAQATNTRSLATLDNQVKLELGYISADNARLLQTSTSASNAFQEVVKNLAAIAVDDTLNQNAKDLATANQLLYLNQQMQLLGVVSNTEPGSALDLSQFYVQTSGTAPGTTLTIGTDPTTTAGNPFHTGAVSDPTAGYFIPGQLNPINAGQ